jgi:cathepsin K
MTIVGYNDDLNAFRIVNSWATDWGDNGFAWISYDLMKNPDFCFAVYVPY